MSTVEIAFGRIFFAIPVLWIFAFIDGIPEVNEGILWVYVFALPLELIALLLYIKALSISPLSLTTPFLSFTPAFLLITSPIILGEHPARIGMIGVLLIVMGAYVLNLSSIKKGFLYPFRRIIKEKGSLMMLIVAFIYSITANFGKMGVLYSSPTFFAASYFSLLGIIFFFLMVKKKELRSIIRKELMIIGVLSAIMITFHMIALKLIYVSYMISIKRSSLLFGIVFGVVLLNEKGLKEKIAGGLLMIAGMIIISFLG